MNDMYGTALMQQSTEPPNSHDGISVPGWHAFHPDHDGFEELREIHVVDRPLVLRAHRLPEDVAICLIFFRDSGDCTKSTATPFSVCGKPVCLTCCHTTEILAVPGRYAPVIDGDRDDWIYLEEQKISTEMGSIAIQQLKCCCD